jgi:hypothetical protein
MSTGSEQYQEQYRQALHNRAAGQVSSVGPNDLFYAVKPEFYADSTLLIRDVRQKYKHVATDEDQYGLVGYRGVDPTNPFSPWSQLERALKMTARAAFDETASPVRACPYVPALKNLGAIPLAPIDGNEQGLDRLREVSFPGANFAPALIVNILRKIPAIAAIHGATASPENVARASARSLLDEPLHHPQQHAAAFVYCLTGSDTGGQMFFDRKLFLPAESIRSYTRLSVNSLGKQAVEWSKPTRDFTLQRPVTVANRLRGPEFEGGDHTITYPAGTRLGNIMVNEPTIGCPGKRMAYDMWDQALDVIVGEKLWDM